jgi:SAM-dependent methyltransferase
MTARLQPTTTRRDGHGSIDERSRELVTQPGPVSCGYSAPDEHMQRRWTAFWLHLSFLLLFIAVSPIYYFNKWDFKRNAKRNPFFTSRLVRIQARFPILYELAMLFQNFPSTRFVYRMLPAVYGDVLQVGCGTGLLNRYMRGWRDIRLTNLDSNLNALHLGVRLGRFSSYVHASIDKKTPFANNSFDVVLFARCLHHVRKHKSALQECARILRPGGKVIILDPVVLDESPANSYATGHMGNSSIDGVIWRFTRNTFEAHLKACAPESLSITRIEFVRQPHVTNYNLFVPQTDALAILTKEESASCRNP